MSHSHFGLMSAAASSSSSAEQISLRAYLDFDGTLTLRPGSEAVYTDLYCSLQKDPTQSYAETDFLSQKEMIEKLKNGLQDPDYKTMSLAPGALQFLQNLFALKADVVIVTRNRKEYIEAMLILAGMDEQLLKQILIKDVYSLGNGKFGVVCHHEKTAKSSQCILVCDDSKSDCQEMVEGAKQNNPNKKIIHHCKKPGEFNWDAILEEVKNNLGQEPGVFPACK